MSNIHVEALYSYPVKSCAPLAANEFEVTEQGLQFDREWVVTRSNGVFLSQRNTPELALVRPEIIKDELVLHAPSSGSVSIPLQRDADKEKSAEPITIFEKSGTVYTEGKEVCEFFSDFLSKEVLLKRSVKPRPINPKYRKNGASNGSKNADGYPLLLTSVASLALFNLDAGRTVPMSRFRPNIVVSGDGLLPYVEDYWREVRIGKLQTFVIKACNRCPIPDIDQSTGQRDADRFVTKTLQETRSGMQYGKEKRETFFGQNLLHMLEPGLHLQVGDSVEPTKMSGHRNFIED